MPVSDPIGILIADDHRIVREGLRLILESREEFTLLGEAADGAEAVRLAAELNPDVILMDLRMPGMDGITAIENIRARDPQAAIVILTTYNEDDLMVRGLRAGGRGFLLEETGPETFFRAVRPPRRSKEIAVTLGITERTVKAHLASIYNKLGVDSRAAAIAIAAQKGWLSGGK